MTLCAVIGRNPQVSSLREFLLIEYLRCRAASEKEGRAPAALYKRTERCGTHSAGNRKHATAVSDGKAVAERRFYSYSVSRPEFKERLRGFPDFLHRNRVCRRKAHRNLVHARDPDHAELTPLKLKVLIEFEGLYGRRLVDDLCYPYNLRRNRSQTAVIISIHVRTL